MLSAIRVVVVAFAMWSSAAFAQSCNGQFQAGQVCGNPNSTQMSPGATSNPVLGSNAIPGSVVLFPRSGAPGSSVNGQMWTQSTGIYAYINGAQIGPLSSSSSASFAATSPLAVTFPSNVVTYALSPPSIDGEVYSYSVQSGAWVGQEAWPAPNPFVLRSTYTQIAAMVTASPAQLNALVWGDSVAGLHATPLLSQLGQNIGFAGAFGCTGALTTGTAEICVTSNSTSGTVTPISGDFAHFPTGTGESLAVNACQVYGSGGGYATANNFSVFYIAEPGAGTITLSTNKNGAGFIQQATANAANATTIGAVISATMGDTGPYTFEVCASGAGPVKIWMGGFVNSTINGLVYESINAGGIALSDMLYTSSAVTTPWYTVLNPNLVTFEMKNDAATETPPCANRTACLSSFVSTWTAINTYVDFLLLGSSPVNTSGGADATQVTYNADLRAVAIANNAFYWDGYYPALNYATEVGLGWITNVSNPHQTTLGQVAESNLLWSMVGLGSLINANISNGIVNNSVETNALAIGNSPNGTATNAGGTFTLYGGLSSNTTATLNLAGTNGSVGNAKIVMSSITNGGSLTSSSTIYNDSNSQLYFESGYNPMGTVVPQYVFGAPPSGTNTNGKTSTIVCGALSTGTGTDGDCVFQTGVKNGSSGSTAATPTTALTIKGETQAVVFGTQQTQQGLAVLANTAAGAYSTTIKSSNSASAAWTLTLPTTAGTNGYALTTNGSGVSSWTAVASPCTTTANSLQYDNSGLLGCVSGATSNGTSVAFTTLTTFNLNTGSLPTAQTGTIVQVGNANSTITRIEADAFGATAHFTGVRADGTAASPTTLQANDNIASFNDFGYDGSAYVGPQAAFRCYAAQNWAHGSALGTYCDVAVTPDNGTTLTESVRFENSGAVTMTSASSSALAVGLNGATNPAFVVDASTGSQAAGLSVKGAATGGTVAIAAIDSGSNTNLTINAKGSGTIGIGNVSTGAVTVTPPLNVSEIAITSCSIGSLSLCAGSSTPLTITAAGLEAVANATDSSSGSTGSINTAGGLGVTKSIFVGGNAVFGGTITAASLGTGTQVSCLGLTSGNVIIPAAGACGGSGSPGGSNTQVQYNASSSFGGITGVTSNGTSMTFATGDLIINGASAAAGIATVTSGGVVSSESVGAGLVSTGTTLAAATSAQALLGGI